MSEKPSFEFMTAEMEARLLGRWEALVREEPKVARRVGPPNWLVKKRRRGNESHLAAADRVRREYLTVTDTRITVTPVTDKEITVTEAVTDKEGCRECGKSMVGRRAGAVFCSPACKMKARRRGSS